ncbi:E3 ubiquitin-protein ligase RGLG4-like isoform X1 [Neltuma alba]|uniref:E3 ubiquitin-protein ligase RGLG4-like isoform X1 n=2 Tax=Neltuma alba TaxID=207710 RepID=UPI0010A43382|nr:E3 ubiquitin-protein ligase RGLG4-like isoform X1 [Prosopis alba]XP_028799661.1 E3 ubiquitin-protein ligase RGLG4-like isoform X1 [Prosopis alba]XP_028799662.1 E3 ubiquitin-protein ligase RGLG4-like isoform X1 [Prosopis alba]XP_028799663.1 E3 ubiquitin-protein ligase RGLG4-like isoform X1 [Prosopis alba]
MGNAFVKKRNAQFSRNVKEERGRSRSSNLSNRTVPQPPRTQPQPPEMMQRIWSNKNRSSGESSVVAGKESVKKKYALIPDNFTTLEQVTAALRKEGLESSNLILGIDFTKSNEWTGKVSFNNRSLHAIGSTPNPYEKAISIIGKTLAPFDDDNLIPCFGFGDATTHDQEVFSFHSDHSSCHGFEEVLDCYQKIVPNLKLSGPTSYGPVIEAAIDIVEKNGGQFHVLVIIADGQVTRSVNYDDGELSPQEQKTIQAIVEASSYPLSIVLVGVGDGPWEDMRKFDDKIPARDFDNFQFVNFTEIMSKNSSPSQKEAAFALAALMEIPFQYKAAIELKRLGRTTGRAKKIVPRPPPVPYSRPAPPARLPSSVPSDDERNQQQACPICLTNAKDLAFGCGHMTCRDCGSRLTNCPICRERITSRLRVFTG